MGYFINGSDIAKATIKPAKVSLAGNPNYIQFEANVAAKGKPVEIQLKLTGCGYVFIRPDVQGIKIYENISSFSIIEAESGIEHKFEGTSDPDKLNEPGAYRPFGFAIRKEFLLGFKILIVKLRGCKPLRTQVANP